QDVGPVRVGVAGHDAICHGNDAVRRGDAPVRPRDATAALAGGRDIRRVAGNGAILHQQTAGERRDQDAAARAGCRVIGDGAVADDERGRCEAGRTVARGNCVEVDPPATRVRVGAAGDIPGDGRVLHDEAAAGQEVDPPARAGRRVAGYGAVADV